MYMIISILLNDYLDDVTITFGVICVTKEEVREGRPHGVCGCLVIKGAMWLPGSLLYI